jgi:quinol monooxygenase YgiN
MAIYKTATYLVRQESVPKVKEIVESYIQDIRAREPGTVLYLALQDMLNPQRFIHVYAFADEAAETRHHDAAITREFTRALTAELVGDVHFGDFNLVATT